MNLIKWISVTNRYTKMYLDRMLMPLGLNSSQHMYIIKICEEPGITQDQLFGFFHINPSNITRSLAALEQQGFLQKRINPKDKRTSCLYPTEKGIQVCGEIQAICDEWKERLLGQFTQEEQQQFLYVLSQVGQNAIEQVNSELEEKQGAL